MPAPQFIVMTYLVVTAVFEAAALAVVFAGYVDVRSGRYKTKRDLTEATTYRLAGKAFVALMLVLGGFWS